MPLASQIELPERYRVARHIASGGMASVWEVEDLLLGRIVAVKVLGSHFAMDPRARARFQREARTAAQVSAHPNVVTIYDIGEHGDDAFIVMEYFSGGTVADRLRAARAGSPIDRETALRWLREAASGLDVAHEVGIVHRDVKPANLLLDARGRVAVADFGIARLADDTHMTSTGQVLGTAAYLSPEQATGQPATPASDRYALAVVAYELLSGRRPFNGGPPAAQMRQHAEEHPPRASEAKPELPSAVDPVLTRGLAKDPTARPATATEFVDDLERALAEATPKTRTRRLTPIPPPPAAPASASASITPTPTPVAPARPTPAAPAPTAAPPTPAPRPTPPPAPPPSAAPRAAAPVTPPPPSRSDRRPLVAVLAIAAVLVGTVVGIALLRDGPGGGQRASDDSSTTKQEPRKPARKENAATTKAPAKAAQQPAPAPPPAPAQTADPATLNDRGFRLMKQGQYAAAVEPLRASVQGYRNAGRTDELGYYFALFNLGVSLNQSGNPEGAVTVLRERLKSPNQRATVERELAAARKKLGAGTQGDHTDAGPSGNGGG